MSNNNDISDADRKLFRRSMDNVQKMKEVPISAVKSRAAPVHGQRKTRAEYTVEKSTVPVVNDCALAGRELFFKRTGIQDRLLEKLRRGKFPIEQELDLHGMISTKAQITLIHFLDHCRHKHIRCVRIIHGKGRGSREGIPVIKHKLNQWLQKIPQVLAFCPARARNGGTGAVYVLLKLSPRR